MPLWSVSLRRYPLYRYQTLFKGLFIVTAVAIYILAVLPQDQAPHFSWSDKANHIFAFVVLGLLFRLGFRLNGWKILAVLILFGISIEVSQYFTPTRSAEWADIGADTIGSLIGLKLYKYLRRIFR